MRAAVQSQRGGDFDIFHEIPEEPARRSSHSSASLCLDGPTEKYGCIIPHTKSARPRNSRKSWQHFEHLRTATALV
jgi:hypothetical protein